MFRAICLKSTGELVATIHNDFSSAYHICVPVQKLTWHIMLYLPAKEIVSSTRGAPVLISYNEGEPVRIAWWIQEFYPPSESFPALTIPL